MSDETNKGVTSLNLHVEVNQELVKHLKWCLKEAQSGAMTGGILMMKGRAGSIASQRIGVDWMSAVALLEFEKLKTLQSVEPEEG